MHLFSRALLLLAALSSAPKADACDVCGTSASNPSLGLLPQFSKNFAGIQFQYSSAESKHPSLFTGKPDEESHQTYATTLLWGRYHIARRFQIAGILPYINNVNAETAQTTNSEGLGDATLMVNYSFPLKEGKKEKQLLLAGAGLKLPTGKYTGASNAERNGLPNVQTGSGSWDILMNINYTCKKAKWGYNLDLTGILTRPNKQQYKFGNRLNTNAVIFYTTGSKSFKIIPQAGLRCEYALHDYDNYSKRWLNEKTGGTMGFASIGTQLLFKSYGIKANLHLPFYQNYAAGYVHSNPRYEGGFFILF
ncbi:MAG: hypothetical protein WC716_01280 [Chitinophagaceae bacterium]|jgi:hypothetical protein